MWLRTIFKVFEGLFTVILFTVTMETLHSQALQTHVTGQVITPDIACKLETKTDTHGIVSKKVVSAANVNVWLTLVSTSNCGWQLKTLFTPFKFPLG